MKRINRIISIILVLAIFLQTSALADTTPVIIKKFIGTESTEIFRGDISDFEDFDLSFDGTDAEHMVIFDWENSNEAYVISKDTSVIPESKMDLLSQKSSVFTRNANGLYQVNPEMNLQDYQQEESVIIQNDAVNPDIDVVSSSETEHQILSDIPEIKNLPVENGISLMSSTSDVITATSFNTITVPGVVNGIKEPKISDKDKVSEEVSQYSGELTLRFNDITLPGRNGLDLNIGRIYQTAHANLGQLRYMAVPTYGEGIKTAVLWDPSNYYLDRYDLGAGWAFSFPSVEVIKEYEFEVEITQGPYIDENKELYYHTGDGDVYKVIQSSNTDGSNLKGYYKKDLKFDYNDTTYTRNGIRSAYSVTLSNGTKQFFAEDGRLMAIRDRFGNSITFEHELKTTTNYVPNGTFAYDNEMWELSEEDDFYYSNEVGKNDSTSMMFNNFVSHGSTYMRSKPIQVNPGETYELSLDIKSKYDDCVKINVFEYDWEYSHYETIEKNADELPFQTWEHRTYTIEPEYFTRYIRIEIEVEGGSEELYIDNVCFDKPKPIISNITDSIGRNVTFTYNGEKYKDSTGSIVVDITAPDGNTKELIYNKSVMEYVTDFEAQDDQRFYWYLTSSDTECEINSEGKSSSKTYYTYDGGKDNSGGYIMMHSEYNSKSLTYPNSYFNKPVLDSIKYRNKKTNFEYETTRKNLGKRGFYDSLRVVKRYDSRGYIDPTKLEIDETTGALVYKGDDIYEGELNCITYDYSGTYDGNSYNDETGYPNYEFNDETTLGEQWKCTSEEKGLRTESVFSNGVLSSNKVLNLSNDLEILNVYSYHSDFKNLPVEIVRTIEDDSGSITAYSVYDYNEWGGLRSSAENISPEIYNNETLLEKYKTNYEYSNTYKLITKQSYYNNTNGEAVEEINTYDSLGRLLSSTDAMGKTVEYEYNNSSYSGIPTKETVVDPQGLHTLLGGPRTVTTQYDAYGLYPVSVTENFADSVKQTRYLYEYVYGNVLRQYNPDGGVIYNMYDAQGRVVQNEQPYIQGNGEIFKYIDIYTYRPRSIHLEYDNGLYQIEEVTRYAYNPDTQRASVVSQTWGYYDTEGNLRVKAEADFSQSTQAGTPILYELFYYDNYGRLIQVKDVNGVSTSYMYDTFDRITKITDAQNNCYITEYDDVELSAMSYFQNSEDEYQNHMLQQFDVYGNLLSRTVYPDGLTMSSISESYTYDISGNVLSKTDPNGNVTQYYYDNLKRLNKTILPDGTVSKTNYNYFNNPVVEKIYNSENEELFSRISVDNEKGEVSDKFYSWNNTLRYNNSYEYSAKGNLINSAEGNNIFSYGYDYCDNEIARLSGESTIVRRYNKYGLLLSVANNSTIADIQYLYDERGRISIKYQSNFNTGMQVGYTTKNFVSSVVSPYGTSISYAYDNLDRLSSIAGNNGNYVYSYYDNGMLESITYPNGVITEYTYDNINRVKTIISKKNDTVINSLTYTHDNNGNVLTETRNGKTTTYTYDSLNRLKTANYGNQDTITYEYDSLNNRTKEIHSTGLIKDYVYDSRNRLAEVKENGEITDTYEYNESGALTKHNNRSFVYNEWGTLLGVVDGSNTYLYGYDVNGIRSLKLVNGNATQYFTDINENVISEADGEGNMSSEIVYGNQALSRKISGNWYYYLYNAHGDVIGLTDAQGNVVNSYEYDAWGTILADNETVANPIKYAGQYYDEELGMYYLRARYYDPSIGRFISVDKQEGSIIEPLDMNQYVYCRNNPIMYVDLNGEAVVIAGIVITGEVLALIGTGFVIFGYLASKAFVSAFTSAINNRKTIRDSIIYAKGKTKDPTPPSKLKDGDKVKTPDSHPDEFKKNKDGSYEHKKTGWKFKKDYSRHGGDHWDASPDGKSGNYINVNPDGTIR